MPMTKILPLVNMDAGKLHAINPNIRLMVFFPEFSFEVLKL